MAAPGFAVFEAWAFLPPTQGNSCRYFVKFLFPNVGKTILEVVDANPNPS